VALACSAPPEGQKRWTLRLLADKLVALVHPLSVFRSRAALPIVI